MSRLSKQSQQFNNVEIIHKSIFDWDIQVEEPCFFLALEVIVCFMGNEFFIRPKDNFAHDAVRYRITHDINNNQPLQTRVVINPRDGEMEEHFEAVKDPLITRFR